MKKLFLIISCLLGLAAHSSAQVSLELVNPSTGLYAATVVPGGTFVFNVEVVGLTAADPLDGFNVALASSTTATTLPTGFTVSFSNILSGFTLGATTTNGDGYDTAAASTSSDVSTTTPVILLTATFTAPTTVTPNSTIPIDFYTAGTQLYYYNSTTKKDVAFTGVVPVEGSVVVAAASPEPGITSLFLSGLILLVGFHCIRGRGFHRAL